MEGYIFVNCEPLLVWEIAEAAVKVEGVKMAHAVTGQFDVIAYVDFANMDRLREIELVPVPEEGSANLGRSCHTTKTKITFSVF